MRAPSVASRSRRWRSNPSGHCSQERLTRGTVTSTMRKAAHPSGCARCGAGAGCSAIKYQSLSASRSCACAHNAQAMCGAGTGCLGINTNLCVCGQTDSCQINGGGLPLFLEKKQQIHRRVSADRTTGGCEQCTTFAVMPRSRTGPPQALRMGPPRAMKSSVFGVPPAAARGRSCRPSRSLARCLSLSLSLLPSLSLYIN